MAALDLEQQNLVQGFLQRTHAVLEVTLRKAAEDALREVAAQALCSASHVVEGIFHWVESYLEACMLRGISS